MVYDDLKNYEKDLEYYKTALKGFEETMGKNHPSTLDTVVNIAIVYKIQKGNGKAEELYQRALEGYEAQLGKDHQDTMRCATNLAICLAQSGEKQKLRVHLVRFPHLMIDQPQFASYI